MRVSKTRASTRPVNGPNAPRAKGADSPQDDASDQRDDDPAVILDGALKDATAGADNSAPAQPPRQINRLI